MGSAFKKQQPVCPASAPQAALRTISSVSPSNATSAAGSHRSSTSTLSFPTTSAVQSPSQSSKTVAVPPTLPSWATDWSETGRAWLATLDGRLYTAAKEGRTADIMPLIRAGADVNCRTAGNPNGFTPLMEAAFHGHDETVKLLLAVPGIEGLHLEFGLALRTYGTSLTSMNESAFLGGFGSQQLDLPDPSTMPRAETLSQSDIHYE